VGKPVVTEAFKAKFKAPIPDMPTELHNENNMNEINYTMLLGPKYFESGKPIDCFLLQMIIRRIVRFLKMVPTLKKVVKKSPKKSPARPARQPPAKKGKAKEKLVNEFIETNKVKKQQSSNQFLAKGLIEDLIRRAVDVSIAECHKPDRQQRITKFVYVTEPEFPELEYG
jgi:hypothetical protein